MSRLAKMALAKLGSILLAIMTLWLLGVTLQIKHQHLLQLGGYIAMAAAFSGAVGLWNYKPKTPDESPETE